jgi:hypothetical protein
MPGAQGYGPGGKWIHDRANRIMEDGDTPKSIAYAVATQQAHATGKSPKDFRTSKGVRKAKAKYDEPKTYQKAAAAAGIGVAKLAGFLDELDQIEKEAGKIRNFITGLAMTGALAGGGAKAVKSVAAHHAPTAITQSVGHATPTTLGVGGLGGKSIAAKEIQEFMP